MADSGDDTAENGADAEEEDSNLPPDRGKLDSSPNNASASEQEEKPSPALVLEVADKGGQLEADAEAVAVISPHGGCSNGNINGKGGDGLCRG